MKQTFALLAVAVACAACTTPASVDQAGLTEVSIKTHDPRNLESMPAEGWRCGAPIAEATYTSGKEVGTLEFERRSDCTVKVTATEVKAFDGQAFAAEVAKVQANEQGQTIREVAPDAIPALVDLARTFAGS